MNREITFKETVELFITTTIYELLNEKETPRINIIFNKDAYKLFYEIMNNPFEFENGWTPNIKEEDIKILDELKNGDYPTIYINDHIKFFTYLTDITNNLIKLYNKYNENKISRKLLIELLRRIWLRMNITDFNNIEDFLYNQLEFIKTDLFEDYKFKNFKETNIIDTFNNYKVTATNNINRTWDESTKCMSFEIITDNKNHSLPNINYDIINDTCYIYAIQNNRHENKNPEIDKLIYKKYKGACQPNKVYALKLFIKMLKEKNIKNIKIPILQVLNYRYHELLSIKEKETFHKIWDKEKLERMKKLSEKDLKQELYYYKLDKTWYNNVVDNEDNISKLKTEDLINLIYKITEEDNTLYITNDIDISDTLDIKIKLLKQE